METKTKISTQNLNLYYGENHALKDVSLDLYENKITAFIGPSGCGKSTYLKTLNRMNDLVPGVKIEGSVRLDDEDIYDSQVDTTLLRKKIGKMCIRDRDEFPAAFIILTQGNRHGPLQPFAYVFNRPCHLPDEMIFIYDDRCVWKEGLCKFGIGPPHIADKELYL